MLFRIKRVSHVEPSEPRARAKHLENQRELQRAGPDARRALDSST